MKIILTGATGFIGQEVLRQCMGDNRITSLYILVRRNFTLPSIQGQNPTQTRKVIVVEDFEHYPASVLEELAGTEGCIWTVGTTGMKDPSMCRKVNIDYTMAGATTFANSLAVKLRQDGSAMPQKKFRFVYTSGMLAVTDQTQKLWFLEEFRKIRVGDHCSAPQAFGSI